MTESVYVKTREGDMSQPETFTTKEAAGLLRVSPLTLWRWHSRGLAHPVQVGKGGRLRWPRREVDRLLGISGD